MPQLLAPPLPPGCPWSGFTPPNVDWCEQELCAWVVNPSDTWWNLLYLALGLWMWHDARSRGRADLRLFGPASIAVGLFSGIYHASYTWLLQSFDFVGMFVFCFVVIARNARRLGWVGARGEPRFFLAGVAASSALVPPLFAASVPIQGTVALCIALALGQEAWLRRGAQQRLPRAYWIGLALLAAAGDGAYLVVPENLGRHSSLVERIIQISNIIKRICKAKKIIGISAIQAKREAENKEGESSVSLKDLFGGDAWAQDADYVLLVSGKRGAVSRRITIGKSRESNVGEFNVRFSLNPKPRISQKH